MAARTSRLLQLTKLCEIESENTFALALAEPELLCCKKQTNNKSAVRTHAATRVRWDIFVLA